MKKLIVVALMLALLMSSAPVYAGYQEFGGISGYREDDNCYTVKEVEENLENDTAVVEQTDTKRYHFNEQERYILLHIGEAEAGNQGVEGIALVYNVIMNRCEKWGMTVEEVVFQPYQFSPIMDGSYYSKTPCQDCYTALEMVEDGWDESQGALYFCMGWFGWADYLFSYKDHNFFK